MPPARSGIADYSSALVRELLYLADVTIFQKAAPDFDPAAFDIALYQLGNNAEHGFVYEAALRFPGVVVMHEANLHHLIAEITIRRGDWDGYVGECDFEGGELARKRAETARTLVAGPDYEGVPMLRRIASVSRGVIAHSQYVMSRVREAGFRGPGAVIPHGAWVDPAPSPGGHAGNRSSVRSRLGLDEATPLIGSFGYLKPYKRIPETLRALRRLVRIDPRVRMILGGEPHPDLPLESLLRTLQIEPFVRVLGYTSEPEFDAFINASDIVVNLRHPTVGESSGSLLRAFSAGRPALVSDVGAFAELPDEVCLKTPVGTGEEDTIFEYLHLLVTRPDVGRQIGESARQWAARECAWSVVARKYVGFLSAIAAGEEWVDPPSSALSRASVPDAQAAPIEPGYVQSWASGAESRDYVAQHSSRLARTLEITPPGDESKAVLEMGAYLQITPALKHKLGYGVVRGCYFGHSGRSDRRSVASTDGERFDCVLDHFDAEKDPYPYDSESFDTVLCCELIEHLFSDPMYMMSEVNRILKPGGHLVLTTPNAVSYRAVSAILGSYHPGFFTNYLKPDPDGLTDARHNREYAPGEIQHLLANAGFEIALLETGPFRDEPHPEFAWVRLMLEKLRMQTYWREDGIYAVGRKTGPVRDRWPAWLYA